MSASQRETKQIERRRHAAATDALPIGEHLLDVQVVAFELLGKHQAEPSAVQPKLADVEETSRAQPAWPSADPFEEAGEHRREHVGSIDIGLLDRRQSGAELAELWLDHRTKEGVELIDDREGRIDPNRADLDDLHAIARARRIPTRRFQVNHEQPKSWERQAIEQPDYSCVGGEDDSVMNDGAVPIQHS